MNKIALQLWTVRRNVERDMFATLREVAAMGYGAVEFAGLGTATSADVRSALDDTGLTAASAHVPLGELLEQLPAVVEQLQTLGCKQAVVPWIPEHYRGSLTRARELAGLWNDIGARLDAAGIAFAYHNEDYDFAPLAGTTLWHALVEHTDPAAVVLQLDVGTATLMHADPIALLRDFGPRITSVHLSDVRDGAYVPLGMGELDWPAILDAVDTTAARWLIIEQDGSEQELVDAAGSLQYLDTLLTQE